MNDFSISYRSDGSIEQFFTDLSVIDPRTDDEYYRYALKGDTTLCVSLCVSRSKFLVQNH